MTMTPEQHMLADSHLTQLERRLNTFGDIEAELKDNILQVLCTTTQRRMTVTVAPRPDDGGTLWFYSATCEAIIEADNIVDGAVLVAGWLRS